MNRRKVVGVGCFGKPEAFFRMFNKFMKYYILHSIGGLTSERAVIPLTDDVIPYLEQIVADSADPNVSGGAVHFRPEMNRVAGFHLAHDESALNLSIFARSHGRKLRRYSFDWVQFHEIQK